MHYPPIAQVDWLSVCGAKEVQLVVCLPVVRELDDKKSDSRLGDRAKRAIKEVRERTRDNSATSESVTVAVFNRELRPEDFQNGALSPDSHDDQIVNLARLYREQFPGAEVAVVTEDFGVQLRCDAGGIAAIEIDTSLRLENPTDELQKNYLQVVQENSGLKNRLPQLSIALSQSATLDAAGKQPAKFELPNQVAYLVVDREVNAIKKKYPKSTGKYSCLASDLILMGGITSGQWQSYHKELDVFYEKCREYVEGENEVGRYEHAPSDSVCGSSTTARGLRQKLTRSLRSRIRSR